MNRLLEWYAYIAALILAPLSAYLWWQTYGDWMQWGLAWGIPIIWAYIVPGVGTNICKVWEIKSRFQLGRFRVQHGFVFGSATSLIAWLIHQPTVTLSSVIIQALVVCSVIGFWNIIYDIIAIKAGVLHVYNQPWAEGQSVDAIVMDYAPWIFGGFGFCYGLVMGAYDYIAHQSSPFTPLSNALFYIVSLIICIAIPVLGVMLKSKRLYGHYGVRPRVKNEMV